MTTFYFRYADARGRGREVKLGRLGDVSVEQARRRAEQLKASVSLGADPVAEKAKRRSVPTLADFARDRYLPDVRERLRSAGNIEAYLRRRILPALGRRALDEITPEDVAMLRRRLIAEGLSSASVNRHLATLRGMLNLALKWRLFEGRNPAAAPGMLAGATSRPLPERRAELRRWRTRWTRTRAPRRRGALALLIVTGARKNEILRATWDMVDLGRSPAHRAPLEEWAPAIHPPVTGRRACRCSCSAGRRVPGNPHVFPERPPPGQAPGKPAGGMGAREEARRLACGSAHPRPASLLRVGARQCRHAALRDRSGARASPAFDHHPLRPPRAAAPGGDRRQRRSSLEPAARTGGCRNRDGRRRCRRRTATTTNVHENPMNPIYLQATFAVAVGCWALAFLLVPVAFRYPSSAAARTSAIVFMVAAPSPLRRPASCAAVTTSIPSCGSASSTTKPTSARPSGGPAQRTASQFASAGPPKG